MNVIYDDYENALYADDTAIACVCDGLIALEKSVNSILARLLDWCRFSNVFLNPSKFKFIQNIYLKHYFGIEDLRKNN